ncbi:hypothetical protein IQ16_02651 [Bradyrhizobium huanghuaihaiense]|uniref:Uncharacterized protein n=1 Tax=Bradyrhizobium huanghuaihaiense TaxID=990078 RepID=A0A562RSC0_9BRAD|nr:hypothetical protein [Bradyrhizobium huanghuaihaiense]TWI71977.1 hypothetical protein IQ16_02651 [Bradyrhizobium huanghuaihaiense]
MMFDPQLRAKSAELQAAVSRLADTLLAHEAASGSRKRARKEADAAKFSLAVEALACNLILLKATGSNAKLAVPRSHAVLWQGNPVLGQHFLSVIDLLSAVGLIAEGRRGYRISAKSKMPSLIEPLERLADHLLLSSPEWRAIRQLDDPVLVILKEGKDEDGNAATIAYRETAQSRKFAKQVRSINGFLREADIEVVGQDDTGPSLGRDGQIIAPYRRSLRRIFNNATWLHGGRLAGGFWMSMERTERSRIRIDGQRVAEIDYGQLFPRLAYVRAGAPQPEDDLYDVFGKGTGRDGCKKLMNALLFSRGPLKNWPEDTRRHFPDGINLRTAVEMLAAKHAPIAHLFGRALGFQLMRIESDMLIEVLTELSAAGVTALPLHDAVLVAKSHVGVAQETMGAAFQRWSRSSCAIVSVKFPQ